MPVDLNTPLTTQLNNVTQLGQQSTVNNSNLVNLRQASQLQKAQDAGAAAAKKYAAAFKSNGFDGKGGSLTLKGLSTPGQNLGSFNGDSGAGRNTVIKSAEKYLGTDYVFGGGGTNGPSGSAVRHGSADYGFDCSGLMQYAFAQAGIKLPRQSDAQLKAMGKKTSLSNLRPGDLVGWNHGGHVALYIGNGQIVEAPHTGAEVRIRKVSASEGVFGVRVQYPGE